MIDMLADLAKAGDALGAARVDTDDVDAARAEDPFVAGQVPLAFAIRDSGGHMAAQRLVAGRVVRTQRLFDPGQPELLHGLHAADRRRYVPVDLDAEVDHDVRLRSDRFAHSLDERNVARVFIAQVGVALLAETHFDSA